MADASKTPVPPRNGNGGSNGNGRRNAIGIGGVVGIVTLALALFAFLGVPTIGDIQTKADAKPLAEAVKDVSVRLEAHSSVEAVRVGKLETDSAVHATQIEQLLKAYDRYERVSEAQTANIETLMRSVEIPERQIRKTKER